MTNQTSLIEACQNDASVETIRSLLDNGADVRARDYDGRTPLLWACEYSTDIKVLELLIARGANVNDIYWPSPSQRNDHSALTVVCREDKPSEFVELLLSNGADPNYQVYDTPLAYCFGNADYSMDYEVKTKFNNTLKTAELLLMAGAKTDTITLDIPLSAHAPEEVILFLLNQCGKRATPEDFYRFCTYAVPSENLINWFMAQGAAQADLRRVIGLLCYQENSYSSIKYIFGLVQHHSYWNTIVSLDADNPYKGTILHYACHNNRQDLVTLFLELGVDPEILDSGCHYVFQLSRPSSVTLSLLKAGKLVVICNDWSKPRSSSHPLYIIIARDKTGTIREQEWNYTDKMGPEIEAHLLTVAKNFAFQCNGNRCVGPAGAPIKEEY
jgi:ankyrin repeat protein